MGALGVGAECGCSGVLCQFWAVELDEGHAGFCHNHTLVLPPWECPVQGGYVGPRASAVRAWFLLPGGELVHCHSLPTGKVLPLWQHCPCPLPQWLLQLWPERLCTVPPRVLVPSLPPPLATLPSPLSWGYDWGTRGVVHPSVWGQLHGSPRLWLPPCLAWGGRGDSVQGGLLLPGGGLPALAVHLPWGLRVLGAHLGPLHCHLGGGRVGHGGVRRQWGSCPGGWAGHGGCLQ